MADVRSKLKIINSHRRWLERHATKVMCPPCSNEKRPALRHSSIVQQVNICPSCKKVWIYRVDQVRRLSDRVPTWAYSSAQPFEGDES